MVHVLASLVVPRAVFVERFRAGLVDEVLVEQFNRRQRHHQAVVLAADEVGLRLVHVDAQAECAVVDAYQFVVAEESRPHGVYQFLVGNREEFPFAYLLHQFHVGGRHVDTVVYGYLGTRVADGPVGKEEHGGNHEHDDRAQYEQPFPYGAQHAGLRLLVWFLALLAGRLFVWFLRLLLYSIHFLIFSFSQLLIFQTIYCPG